MNESQDIKSLMRTVKEIAKETHVSSGYVYSILKEPDGPEYIKLGKKILIDPIEWAAWLERRKVKRAVAETAQPEAVVSSAPERVVTRGRTQPATKATKGRKLRREAAAEAA